MKRKIVCAHHEFPTIGCEICRPSKKVSKDWNAEWDNIEVPTTKELGMEYRQSYYKWIGIPIAILFGVFIGVLLLA